jgi:hypothetical protein
MQNDPIQGILFDADYIVRFDAPIKNRKSVDIVKRIKKLKNSHPMQQVNPFRHLLYELYPMDKGTKNASTNDQAMRKMHARIKQSRKICR